MGKTLLTNEEPEFEGTKNEIHKTEAVVAKEDQKRLDKVGDELTMLFVAETSGTPFAMGDALAKLEAALQAALKMQKVTSRLMSDWLRDNRKIALSGQRICSLQATARYFPNRNGKWSFKDHERARKAELKSASEEKRTKLSGDELIADYASGKRKFEPPTPHEQKPSLTIRVRLDDVGSDKTDVQFLISGKEMQTVDPIPDWILVAAKSAIENLKITFTL